MKNNLKTLSTTKINSEKCRVLKSEQLAPNTIRLRFEFPLLSQLAKPGQFVNIRVREALTPLLRRPFSIHRVSPAAGWVEILFDIRGEGTKLLAETREGHTIDVLGPLGNGFQIPNQLEHAILIGGGIGIAPLLFLAQELRQTNVQVKCYYGVKNQQQLCCPDDFKNIGAKMKIATEDGSSGHQGFVTDLLLIQKEYNVQQKTPSIALFACGPPAMLRAVQQFALNRQVETQLSLESKMGCGFGVCVGCAVPARKTTNSLTTYYLVCQDGPVFRAEEVTIPD